MFHGRVADQHKSHLSHVMSPSRFETEDLEPRKIELDRHLGTDPCQIQKRLVRNSITEDVDEFGKVGAETSYLQSQMHSDYDSAESIADSDLERWKTTKNAGFTSVWTRPRGLKITTNTNCTGETCCNDIGERSKCKAYSS